MYTGSHYFTDNNGIYHLVHLDNQGNGEVKDIDLAGLFPVTTNVHTGRLTIDVEGTPYELNPHLKGGGRRRRGKKSRKSRKGRKGKKSRKNKRRTKRR